MFLSIFLNKIFKNHASIIIFFSELLSIYVSNVRIIYIFYVNNIKYEMHLSGFRIYLSSISTSSIENVLFSSIFRRIIYRMFFFLSIPRISYHMFFFLSIPRIINQMFFF